MAETLEQQRQYAMKRLLDCAGDFAGIAEDCRQYFASGAPAGGFETLRLPLMERYRRLFMPEGAWPADGKSGTGGSSAAQLRWQRASQALAGQTTAIAADAFARLNAALASSDPEAPPITTLRALHELWIECGEAAYAAVAPSKSYADALAELLAAIVEWRAELAAAAR
jgi:hypothetical protein